MLGLLGGREGEKEGGREGGREGERDGGTDGERDAFADNTFDLELVLRNTRKAFLQLYTVAGHNYAD